QAGKSASFSIRRRFPASGNNESLTSIRHGASRKRQCACVLPFIQLLMIFPKPSDGFSNGRVTARLTGGGADDRHSQMGAWFQHTGLLTSLCSHSPVAASRITGRLSQQGYKAAGTNGILRYPKRMRNTTTTNAVMIAPARTDREVSRNLGQDGHALADRLTRPPHPGQNFFGFTLTNEPMLRAPAKKMPPRSITVWLQGVP